MEIKPSGGRVVLNSVTALFLGLLQPLAVMFQIMLPMPGVSLAMLAAAAMYGSTGIIPMIVLGISSAASLLFVYGMLPGLLAMLMWLIPAAVIICGIRRRDAFFSQLTGGIAAAVIVTALAVAGVAVAYGSDVIGLAVDQARASFTGQQELFWEVLAPMFKGADFDQFVEHYYVMFNTLELYYEYYLLSNLFTGAILTAVIAVLWGNWKVARRGGATADSYRGLSQWQLPANTTWGMLMMLAAGFVLARVKIPGAENAWVLVSSLCQLAFMIQCLAALDRRMKKNGSSHGARTVMLLILTILGYLWGMVTLLALMGAASALFGSKGAAKPFIEKFNDKSDGEGR